MRWRRSLQAGFQRLDPGDSRAQKVGHRVVESEVLIHLDRAQENHAQGSQDTSRASFPRRMPKPYCTQQDGRHSGRGPRQHLKGKIFGEGGQEVDKNPVHQGQDNDSQDSCSEHDDGPRTLPAPQEDYSTGKAAQPCKPEERTIHEAEVGQEVHASIARCRRR